MWNEFDTPALCQRVCGRQVGACLHWYPIKRRRLIKEVEASFSNLVLAVAPHSDGGRGFSLDLTKTSRCIIKQLLPSHCKPFPCQTFFFCLHVSETNSCKSSSLLYVKQTQFESWQNHSASFSKAVSCVLVGNAGTFTTHFVYWHLDKAWRIVVSNTPLWANCYGGINVAKMAASNHNGQLGCQGLGSFEGFFVPLNFMINL